jgi:hypothetical protein
MAAQWHRCQSCRGILPVTDFEENNDICVACREKADRAQAKATKAAKKAPAPVTRRTVPVPDHDSSGVTVRRVEARGIPGARGHGDREVRVRRARLRALEHLAESHPEEFEILLTSERAVEGL